MSITQNKALSADNPEDCLQPGHFVDSDHPAIIAYAKAKTQGLDAPLDKALAIYYAVRDEIFYDPYNIDRRDGAYKASVCLEKRYGYCVPKAVLLAAVCRAAGVPARLGFADVRNHLTSAKLRQSMGTDVFVFHGYTDIYLGGKWVKATPAFNLTLCEKVGIVPLDFDGVNDSIYHPFDKEGRKHMEYLRQRGTYFDLPLEEMRQATMEAYGRSIEEVSGQSTLGDYRDFENEAEAS